MKPMPCRPARRPRHSRARGDADVAARFVRAAGVPLIALALAGCGGGDGDGTPEALPGAIGPALADTAPPPRTGAPASGVAETVAPPSAGTAAAPLQIRRQPLAADVHDGAVVEFSVDAQGQGPLGYQWLRDGESIDGETGPRLRLPVTVADDGVRISVVVRAGGATLHSAPALLRVGRT